MCFMGSGSGGGGEAGASTPFKFSKFQVKTDGSDFLKNPFAADEATPEQAITPANLNEDLGITDPLDEASDGGKDKNSLRVSEDDTAKTDRFKKKQTKKDPYKAPSQDGFLNIVR